MKNKQFKYQNKPNLQKQATKIEKNCDSSAFTNNLHNLFYIQYFFGVGVEPITIQVKSMWIQNLRSQVGV